MKRPSSERPIDSAEIDGRNDLKIFMTMNNPSSDLNDGSYMSNHEASRTAHTNATPIQTTHNNYTHEAMLLSGMSKVFN